ncbi:hypothetical protein OE88DRAFT_1417490 [Heliocybe sulcata]|uniref:RGS domain-containing protein n=1 Tax=Heliocybe sulcata TaxID=5364 RepID=A0A5C3N6V2_9AGAM|nr:hypothetical protein OE88DRAFT_1417490 [Heliocybe sulcata]
MDSSKAQRQPKTIRLSIKYLLSLPDRLCNPPPAVGKVRSCGVTPLFKVKLEDVLARTHLPPLGLKDFEEWLLFVENAPENLYFILWLREYTRRYNQWAVRTKAKSATRAVSPTFSVDSDDSDAPAPFAAFEYHVSPGPADPCPSLALFYQRAKQTFLTPGAPYELNVASDVLAPFHTYPASPTSPRGFGCFSPNPSQQSSYTFSHPDPAIFADLDVITTTALRASLDRFVLAAYSNVGTNRGLCGLVGGCAIATAGSLPIWVASFVEGWVRWLRFAALPGLWLGLTIVVASLHGLHDDLHLW